MRVFLDANILFSASKPDSRIRALINLLAKHGECITNDYAIEEARRNLELKAPTLVTELDKLTQKLEIITTLITEVGIKLKLKDIPILGGAIASGATHLLTGDERDFGAYFGKMVQSVKVVSPRMLADELVKQGLL